MRMRWLLLSLLLWKGAASADSAVQPVGNSRFIGFGELGSEAFVDPGVVVSKSRRTLAVYLRNTSEADDSEVGGELKLLSLDDLRQLPEKITLGPYTGEAMRRLRYAAVNQRLGEAGFEVVKDYESHSSLDGFDESAYQYGTPNEA